MCIRDRYYSVLGIGSNIELVYSIDKLKGCKGNHKLISEFSMDTDFYKILDSVPRVPSFDCFKISKRPSDYMSNFIGLQRGFFLNEKLLGLIQKNKHAPFEETPSRILYRKKWNSDYKFILFYTQLIEEVSTWTKI